MPDREIQALIMQAGEIRTESRELRAAVDQFAALLKRGLVRASVQGMVMVIIGVLVSIFFLGLLSQSWSCDVTTLAGQDHSVRYKACAVIFPSTIPQVAAVKRAAKAAADAADNRQAVLDERRKTNEFLDKQPGKIACVLKIRPENRTDDNVNACLTGVSK